MTARASSRVLRVSSITLLALGAPLAFSPNRGVIANDACAVGADGLVTCCEAKKSKCCDEYGCLDDHYDNGIGKPCPDS